MADDAGTDAGEGSAGAVSAGGSLDRRFELLEAILVALAAILTAWAAFQATKWGGVQADRYSRAGAARTESVRASTLAGQQTAVDVNTFVSWVRALAAEDRDGQETGLAPDGTYVPRAGTESAFLYERFRPEFRTAVDAWLATRPLAEPTAAPTPFAVPEYRLAESERAEELEQQAEGFASEARDANQRGDNFVLMTIVFALVLVLVGIGSKMDTLRARAFLLGLAAVALAAAITVVLTFPVEI
jgi:hypothetical protein